MSEKVHWWHGILARSLMAVAGIALLMGGVSSLLVNQVVGERAHGQAVLKLGELLDTVESTVSIAAFVGDAQLAKEVAQGLLRNSEVMQVTIRSNERELVRAARGPLRVGDDSRAVRRPLYSPFKADEVIGEISLAAEQTSIDALVAKDVWFTGWLMAIQLALVIAAATAAMLFLVVRPIKETSDRLHRLDAASGERLAVPESHAKSELGRLVGDINNLTARLVATIGIESALLRQQVIDQRKYRDLFDKAAAGIFVADRDGRLESFNRAFAALTWLPRRKETTGRWLAEAGWQEPERLLALVRDALADPTGKATRADDFLLVGRRGDERWLHVAATPLGDGSVQGTLTDVTKRRNEEISARRLATTDALTGFANRAGLQHTLAEITPHTPPFALVMLDLDGFKRINDAMGFAVGDQLLILVAGRIRKVLDARDQVARVGGDEFALALVGEQSRVALDARVGQLLRVLAEPYDVSVAGKHDQIDIAASAGIAFFPADGHDLQELLRSAELALNSVQAAGGRNFGYFEPAQQVAVEHRHRIEDDLRHALGAGELHLVFQPIIDLSNGRLAGAEALLRWSHPARGVVMPDVFIPLAEELGLIDEIGLMVLRETCRHVATWRNAGLDIYVSVNVSVRQIPDGLPPGAVVGLLEQYGLPSNAIALEITEGVLMNNVVAAQTWIEQLRADGIRIYLDDFGTGYSSLSYLKRFPLDTVKIDKSFIRDMSADNSDRTLVDAIVTMAGSLGLNVIAEGVENTAQFDILRQIGCGYGQGYLFSRPVKGEDFAQVAAHINAALVAGWR